MRADFPIVLFLDWVFRQNSESAVLYEFVALEEICELAVFFVFWQFLQADDIGVFLLDCLRYLFNCVVAKQLDVESHHAQIGSIVGRFAD